MLSQGSAGATFKPPSRFMCSNQGLKFDRLIEDEAERDVRMEDMNNMKYLYPCICETGRISPNVVCCERKITEEIDSAIALIHTD
ncbi:unnamed protein product [Anisakis simplex]|uniref:Clip domain-containing protein n=1 Tax=Anisakis simplex TaxID=6269 RepID=A0A0M3JTV5_ANISI|nr:unnamed protein product [Anisakis simplex]